jgi:uncharacterized protein with NRDE domain
VAVLVDVPLFLLRGEPGMVIVETLEELLAPLVNDVLLPRVPQVDVAVDDEDLLAVLLVHTSTYDTRKHITMRIDHVNCASVCRSLVGSSVGSSGVGFAGGRTSMRLHRNERL